MGTKVTISTVYAGKPEMTIATVAAAVVAVLAGEYVVFVGTKVGGINQLEAFSGLYNCQEALRSLGFPQVSEFNHADIAMGAAVSEVNVVAAAASPVTLTEDDAAVLYHNTFRPGAESEIFDGLHKRMVELLFESTLKVA